MSIISFLLFSNCSKNSTPHSTTMSQVPAVHHGINDFPLPITFKAAQEPYYEGSTKTWRQMFAGTLSIPATIVFYKREMEQAGWNITDLSCHEGLLVCTKQHTRMVISIRQDARKNTTLLMLFSKSNTSDVSAPHQIDAINKKQLFEKL